MIIVDENIDQRTIELLRRKNYEVYAIRERHYGASDHQIAEICASLHGIFMTFDINFAEYLFAHQIKGLSIFVLQQTPPSEDLQLLATAESLFDEFREKIGAYLVCITPKEIRVKNA
ncbi:DUF5615 family PIN-like protein [Rapidithrix thailandica]|uniref:DUF5615 family PIN-like protein n=1 Tax=Rapidithrix thailandica TaxID=413964 RepID=A0AAW9S9S4_9BACT